MPILETSARLPIATIASLMAPHIPTFVHLLRECSTDHDSFHLYLDGWGGQQRRSHAELLDEAARLGQGLLAAGLTRGDRVALMLPQAAQFCPSLLVSCPVSKWH